MRIKGAGTKKKHNVKILATSSFSSLGDVALMFCDVCFLIPSPQSLKLVKLILDITKGISFFL